MRDVEVAADDDGLGSFEFGEVFAERVVPVHSIIQALESALRVWRVHVHEEEFLKFCCYESAFVVVFFPAHAVHDA